MRAVTTLAGKRILLAEDNAFNQELALDLLGEAGMRVTVAGDGRAALAALARAEFDALLMDCQMPVMDGYAATRAIRLLPRWQRLPIIAMTASGTAEDRDRALAAGMDDHTPKPIVVDALFAMLAKWIAGVDTCPPLAKETPTDPLAQLPGIDSAIARRTTMGNDKLFARLLAMFRHQQHDFLPRLQAAFDTGDHALAIRHALDLRGMAGSLGMQAVQRLAGDIETACIAGATARELDGLLVASRAELSRVIAGIDAMAPTWA